MITLDELILTLFLVGLSVFVFYGGKYTLLGYGKKAIQAGFAASLVYFGLILLIIGTYMIISAPQQTSMYSIFAIGFAITAFGYNGFLNLEQSRRIHEMFLRSRGQCQDIRYLDTFTPEMGILLSILLLIWGGAIAVVTGITSDYYAMYFGILIIVIGVGSIIYNIRIRRTPPRIPPSRVDENLCQRVLSQLQGHE